MVLTLKLVRIACGLSLTALQERSHVNATDISRIERGKLIPSAGQVDKLAAALNIPGDELLNPVALEGIIAAGKTVPRPEVQEHGR